MSWPSAALLAACSDGARSRSNRSATPQTSAFVRPQVGHAIIRKGRRIMSRASRIFWAMRTSSIGSAASETRIVFPIPSARSVPMPIALRIVPVSNVPDSVTPMWSG